MLKFQQIIFRKFILIFFTLFIIVGAIVYYWTKESYVTQTKESMLLNIEIISFELDRKSNLDIIAKNIKKSLDLRLTIISSDGTVVAESHQDKTKMDNHKERDEIIQASKKEYGFKIRHSLTVDKDLLYIAKKYTINSQDIYIRLSK